MKAVVSTVVVTVLALAPRLTCSHRVPASVLSVVASGLSRPVGIALEGSESLYFTEVPSPGVAGAGNGVSHLRSGNGHRHGAFLRRTRADQPRGCSRGGCLLDLQVCRRHPAGANSVSVLRGDDKLVIPMGQPEPTDVAVARNGDLYWTRNTASSSSAPVASRRCCDPVQPLVVEVRPVGAARLERGRERVVAALLTGRPAAPASSTSTARAPCVEPGRTRAPAPPSPARRRVTPPNASPTRDLAVHAVSALSTSAVVPVIDRCRRRFGGRAPVATATAQSPRRRRSR